jgi:hypothetical protein
MRAAVTIAVVTLLAVAASAAVASDKIKLSTGCDSSCVCSSSVEVTHNNAANREYCTAGSSSANATGIVCVAAPEVCGNANIYTDSACTGTLNRTATVVCNKCTPSGGGLMQTFTCSSGNADLKLMMGCDATCGTCTTTLDFASCTNTGVAEYISATSSASCNVFGVAEHETSACDSALKTPFPMQPQANCEEGQGFKVECGGNVAASAAVSFAAVALVALLSVVA